MKWNPFKRKSQDLGQAPAMPPELTDYYNAEHRQRSIVTWLLGIATLAVTVALAFALFLGARWAINKIKDRNHNTPQPTTVQTTAPASQPTQTTATNNSGTTTPSTTQNDQTATNTTPKTSSATTNLPNTGPGDVVAIWLGATVLGALLHRRYARR